MPASKEEIISLYHAIENSLTGIQQIEKEKHWFVALKEKHQIDEQYFGNFLLGSLAKEHIIHLFRAFDTPDQVLQSVFTEVFGITDDQPISEQERTDLPRGLQYFIEMDIHFKNDQNKFANLIAIDDFYFAQTFLAVDVLLINMILCETDFNDAQKRKIERAVMRMARTYDQCALDLYGTKVTSVKKRED